MDKRSTANKRQTRRRQEKTRQTIIIALVVIAIGAVGWVLLAPRFQPELGEAIEELPASHVPEGEDPGPYNSDPPTSGTHYTGELDPGFYDEVAAASFGPYPEGYLVHNLEHGYVIFWYNCGLLDDAACRELEAQIQDVMDRERNFKVIAFPRETIQAPVVMTSWNRRLAFDTFDPDLARQFVRTYRNQAPEPQAP